MKNFAMLHEPVQQGCITNKTIFLTCLLLLKWLKQICMTNLIDLPNNII